MNDVTKKNARWWQRLLLKKSAAPRRYVQPHIGDDPLAINEAGADDSAPVHIDPALIDIPAFPPEARMHAAKISTALHRVFGQPQQDSDAAKAGDDPAFRTLASLFPFMHDEPKSDWLVINTHETAIIITPSQITFHARPDESGQRDIKKTFTDERAYAMALVASKSKAMLQNGIRLTGSREQQEMLRIAIERVNNELPEGQKLKILPPKGTFQPAPVTAEEDAAEAQPASASAQPAPVVPAAAAVAESVPAPVVAEEPKSDAPVARPVPTAAQPAPVIPAATPVAAPVVTEEPKSGAPIAKPVPTAAQPAPVVPAAAPVAESVPAPVVAEEPKSDAPVAKPVPMAAPVVATDASNVAGAFNPARRQLFSLRADKAAEPDVAEEPDAVTEPDVAEEPVRAGRVVSRRGMLAAGIAAFAAASMPSQLHQDRVATGGAVTDAKKSGVDASTIEPAGENETRLAAESAAPAKAPSPAPVHTAPPVSQPPAAAPPPAAPRSPKHDFERNNRPKRNMLAENGAAPKGPPSEPADQKPLSGQILITRQGTTDRVMLNLAHTNPLNCTASEFKKCHSDFNYVARDWHRNKIKEMDPALMKVIAEVVTKLRTRGYKAEELTLNSGYRTPQTNKDAGGARKSLHMVARAIDFSIAGVSTRVLCDVCKDVVGKKGWVKRHRGFAHLDTRGYDMRLG